MISTHPRTLFEQRETTKRHAKMEGVQYPTRKCHLCNKHKRMLGYTTRNGKFVCAECK